MDNNRFTMESDYVKALQELLEIPNTSSIIATLFSINKTRQMNQRLKSIENKLKDVLLKGANADAEFFCNKVGTIVIQKIFMDEEDEKAELLILGFENCVQHGIREFDRIIFYFDLLSELRSYEIKRLIELSGRCDIPVTSVIEGSEEELIQINTDRKLIQLNLITNGVDYLNSPAILSGGAKNRKLKITKTASYLLDFLGF